MANSLKPHKSLQQEVEKFLEKFHKGCVGAISADQLELLKSKPDQKSVSIKAHQAITSFVNNNNNYEQKNYSLKLGTVV